MGVILKWDWIKDPSNLMRLVKIVWLAALIYVELSTIWFCCLISILICKAKAIYYTGDDISK